MLIRHIQRRKSEDGQDSDSDSKSNESPVCFDGFFGYREDVRSGAQHNNREKGYSD